MKKEANRERFENIEYQRNQERESKKSALPKSKRTLKKKMTL